MSVVSSTSSSLVSPSEVILEVVGLFGECGGGGGNA